jgi:hypothetical protein
MVVLRSIHGIRNVHKMLIGKPEEKRQFGRPKYW